jgi:hypothetical protein
MIVKGRKMGEKRGTLEENLERSENKRRLYEEAQRGTREENRPSCISKDPFVFCFSSGSIKKIDQEHPVFLLWRGWLFCPPVLFFFCSYKEELA